MFFFIVQPFLVNAIHLQGYEKQIPKWLGAAAAGKQLFHFHFGAKSLAIYRDGGDSSILKLIKVTARARQSQRLPLTFS